MLFYAEVVDCLFSCTAYRFSDEFGMDFTVLIILHLVGDCKNRSKVYCISVEVDYKYYAISISLCSAKYSCQGKLKHALTLVMS